MEHYLPKFKGQDEGLILNVASLLGMEPQPTMSLYSATKSAVISLGQSFGSQYLYDKYKVRVVTICPGATATSMLNPRENALEEDVDFALDIIREVPKQT